MQTIVLVVRQRSLNESLIFDGLDLVELRRRAAGQKLVQLDQQRDVPVLLRAALGSWCTEIFCSRRVHL